MKQTDIKSSYIKYTFLNIIGMIGLSCYILADTFFVSQGIGANGLAALNLAIPVYSFLNGTGLMIGMGGATRFSISKSENIFTQSIYYVLLSTCLFLGTGIFFSDQLAVLLGADIHTLQNTSIYLKTILCFSPMFLLNNVIICFVRNDGNPKLAMSAMLIGSFSNIILDYIFVFPCKMGMFGAAFATGLSPIISLMVLSLHFVKRQNTFKLCRNKLSFKALFDISSIGVSALITEVSSGIVIIVFNMIILKLAGNIGVAAYGIIANIALVVIAVFTGISQGMQPLISRCYSIRDISNTKKILKYGISTALFVTLAIYALSFAFAEPIVSIFNKASDPELAGIAVKGIRIYFTAFAFLGINVLYASYFSAVDKPGNAFIISLLRGFIIIIPTAFILSSLAGITGIWLTPVVTEFIVFLVVILKART